MHKDFEIVLKNISKIEGHTHLDISVKNNKAVSAKLKVSENKRFFTDAVIGTDYREAPTRMARICGTCSPAHLTCACEAIERALGIKLSEQSKLLRELLLVGNNIRDHAMHLYFFCLPDLLNKDSVLDFDKKQEKLIHKALHVKEVGNDLCNLIGGRSVHPTFANVGGFLEIPKGENIKKIIKKLNESREHALDFIELFFQKSPSFERNTNFVALCGKDFNYIDGVIKTSSGRTIKEENYREHVERVILPYSTAAAFEFEFKDFMVGALARMNLNKNELNKSTKKDCRKYLKVFPSNSLFYNNLAQAIEIVHCIDKSMEILSTYEFKNEKINDVKNDKESVGVGVIEAPRGTLYYMAGVDENGKINKAEIIIPTAQNIINLEMAVIDFVNSMLGNGFKKEKIAINVEKLIRAYDPCMSCATHFLKINWK